MKIKCNWKDMNMAHSKCSNCPFRDETEFGRICNLPSRWWNKTIEIKIIKGVK